MKFLPNAILPPDLSQAAVLNDAATKLESKLLALNYKELPLSEYGKRYYAYDLRKLTYMLQSYVFMLLWSQYKAKKRVEELTLLDHGGGIGMLSLLAKLAGFKTVIHQDLNPVISEDAKLISIALGIQLDYFVTGNTIDFVEFVNSHNLNLNIVGSRNVIEHVYNLNQFFEETAKISSDKLILFLSTTANEKNPLVNMYTKQLQKSYELEGDRVAWGEKKRNPERSALNQRRQIILEAFPTMDDETVAKLAKATRGLIKDDIIKSVHLFLSNGIYPVELKHPTNTCAPDSGSWMEHLLPLDEYRKLIERNNFNYCAINGFYNVNYKQNYLNWITPTVNWAIKRLGKNGTALAPFISIVAER